MHYQIIHHTPQNHRKSFQKKKSTMIVFLFKSQKR